MSASRRTSNAERSSFDHEPSASVRLVISINTAQLGCELDVSEAPCLALPATAAADMHAPGAHIAVMAAQDAQFASALGARLRAVRQTKGWTLTMVARASGGSIGSSVLGAYERGERRISLPRLQALAELYDVDMGQLLGSASSDAPPRSPEHDGSLELDVEAVRQVAAGTPLARWCELVVAGHIPTPPAVLLLSPSDYAAVAAMLGCDLGSLRTFLAELHATYERHYRPIG